jgi:membrane protease YdiL (CAAX protease family)
MEDPVTAPIVSAAPTDAAEGEAERPPERISAFRRVPWRLSDVVIGLGVLSPWCAVAYLDRRWLASLPTWVQWCVFVIPPMAWMLLFPVWIAKRRSPQPLVLKPQARKVVREALVAIPAHVAMFAVLVTVMGVAYLIFGERAFPRDILQGASQSSDWRSLLVLFVVAVTIGPASEEVFFRGFLYNALRRRCPAAVANVLQALLFGFLHPYGLAYSMVAFIIGVCLAVIYDRRRTLLTPIMVHAIQNSIAVVRTAVLMIAAANAPRLGVIGATVERGYQIDAVQPGSTAQEIGLRPGDVITAIDDENVREGESLTSILRQKQIGDKAAIKIIRDNRPSIKEAVLRRGP